MTRNFLQILLTIRVKYYTVKCIYFTLYSILSDAFAYSIYIYCLECRILSYLVFAFQTGSWVALGVVWDKLEQGCAISIWLFKKKKNLWTIYIDSTLCCIICLKGAILIK